MKENTLLPDFLIIGAGKCGTTSLRRYLMQHPQIFMTAIKEPNFFTLEGLTPEHFDNGIDNIAYFKECVFTLKDYEDQFRNANEGQVKGESSPLYLNDEKAAENIKRYIPEVKLIAILRQPAERLYSRFMHLARDNKLPSQNFKDTMDKSSIWWKRRDLIQEGFFFNNLKRFYNTFPHQNIRVFLFEDLKSNTEKLLNEIFEFLGVDKNFKPDFSTQFNKSGLIKNKSFNKIIGRDGLMKTTVEKILPKNIYRKAKNNVHLLKILNDLRNKNLEQPPIDIEVKKYLTQEVYREDIEKLQDLIKKDLSHWLN